jgi:hypothetical protein
LKAIPKSYSLASLTLSDHLVVNSTLLLLQHEDVRYNFSQG